MAVSCPFVECDQIVGKSEDVLPHLKLEHYENFSRESVVKPFGPGHKGILIQGILNLDQEQPTTVAHTGTDGLVIVTLRKSPDQDISAASIYAFNAFPKSGTKLTSKLMLKNVNTEEKLTFKNKFFDYENCESKHKAHVVELTQEEQDKLSNDGGIFFHLEYNRKKMVGEPVTEVSKQTESIIPENETENVDEVSEPNQNETMVNDTEKVTKYKQQNKTVQAEDEIESVESQSDENLTSRRKSYEEIANPEYEVLDESKDVCDQQCDQVDESHEQIKLLDKTTEQCEQVDEPSVQCEPLDESHEQIEPLDKSHEQSGPLDESNELSNIKIVEVEDIIERNQPSVQCPIEMCSEILLNAKRIIPHIKEAHADEVTYPSSLVETPRGVQVEGVLFHPGIHPILVSETSKWGNLVLTVAQDAGERVSEPSYNLYMYNVNPNFKVREPSELILKNPHDSEGDIVFNNRLFDYSDGKKEMANNKIVISEMELNSLMLDDVISFEINMGDFCQRQEENDEILDENIQIEPDIQIIEDIDEDYDADGNGSEDSGPVNRPLIQPWPKVMKRKVIDEDMEWDLGHGSGHNKKLAFKAGPPKKVKHPLIQPWPKVMKRKIIDEDMEWNSGHGSGYHNKLPYRASPPKKVRPAFRAERSTKVKSFEPFGGWVENPEEEDTGLKFSNNMKDAVRVQCLLCDEICFKVALRGHTRRNHNGMSITEYKEQFGELVPIENIYHRCGICEKVILLDSDSVAVHLKTPGHNITHKHYNMQYMITRSYS